MVGAHRVLLVCGPGLATVQWQVFRGNGTKGQQYKESEQGSAQS